MSLSYYLNSMRLVGDLNMINNIKFDNSVSEIDLQFSEVLCLQNELQHLTTARDAIREHGSNPTAIALMRASGLLSGTSLDAIAIETFTQDSVDGIETLTALESLDASIDEKKASWSAKIISTVKSFSVKILQVIEPIWNKISELFGKLTSKTWDATKSVGRAIKAHPYKTIMVTVVAIASVAGILAYCGSFLPGSNHGWAALGKFDTKLGELAKKIKLPFGGKVDVIGGTAKNLNHIDVVFAPRNAGSIPIAESGWTQAAAKTCYTQLSSAMNSIKGGIGSFSSRALKVFSEHTATVGHAVVGTVERGFKSVGGIVYDHTGSKTAASAAQMVAGSVFFWGAVNIFHKIWRLIKKIVLGGLRLIMSSVRALFDFS